MFFSLISQHENTQNQAQGLGFRITFDYNGNPADDNATQWKNNIIKILNQHTDALFSDSFDGETAKTLLTEITKTSQEHKVTISDHVKDGTTIPAIRIFIIDPKENKKGKKLTISYQPNQQINDITLQTEDYEVRTAQKVGGTCTSGIGRPDVTPFTFSSEKSVRL